MRPSGGSAGGAEPDGAADTPDAARVWLADANEAETVAGLLVAFRDELGYTWPSDNAFLAGVEKLLDDRHTDYVLGAPHDDAPPAGVAQLRFRQGLWRAGGDCLVEDLYVAPGARRSGLARAIMSFSLQRARERGCRRAELDVNERNAGALALYEGLGFSAGSSAYGGARDLYMRLHLDAGRRRLSRGFPPTNQDLTRDPASRLGCADPVAGSDRSARREAAPPAANQGGSMSPRVLRGLVPLLACSALLCAAPAHATPAKIGPPNVMTALGDSITRGFHTGSLLQDVPANSWATGTNATVNSLCLRIKALNAALPCGASNPPNGGNDAVTGAKAAGTNAQAVNAVARNPKPELVTILIGANDVCASSQAAMTSIASFRSSIDTTLQTLSSGLPNARIQVMSIPNIFNLWNVGRVSASARFVWGLFSTCQSMLANPTSFAAADVARRAAVQQRNIDFNTQLQQACAQYIHCRFDNNAAYNLAFVLSDLSTLDYFHPNIQGQAKAANVAWTSGYSYTDLTAPTTTISRDRVADGSDDWYRDNVSVTLTATDPDAAVSGSEYFYKLVGEVDQPWTKYTAPFTISAEGETEITARSVDANGNIEASKSDLIKIDKTSPTFTLGCPASPYTLGASVDATVSGASDDRSGFATDPNGAYPIDTSVPGNGQPNVVEIQDKAGNTASDSCSYDVHYPDPGAPALSAGATPNADGLFTLAWAGTSPLDFGIRYALQHRDADDADWSGVASSLDALSYAFSGAGESEGTWTYRVQGTDDPLGLTTAWSAASDPVKVDKSSPNAPSVSADRAPDYAGGGGWYLDTVTATFADQGDPALADGSSGSGVDAGSVSAAQTHAASGSHTFSDSVLDQVGNESATGSLGVQVDATNPTIGFTACPAAVLLNATASNTFAAADAHSGLASAASGTTTIDTSTVGSKTTSQTAQDNVGRTASASCTTAVQYMFGGVQQPVNADGSSIFKLGSTVPVKFRLTDGGSASVFGAVATIDVAKIDGIVDGTFVEAVSTAAATTGNLFREAGDGQYIFNLSTKPLTKGDWRLKITLDDGTVYTVRISLK